MISDNLNFVNRNGVIPHHLNLKIPGDSETDSVLGDLCLRFVIIKLCNKCGNYPFGLYNGHSFSLNLQVDFIRFFKNICGCPISIFCCINLSLKTGSILLRNSTQSQMSFCIWMVCIIDGLDKLSNIFNCFSHKRIYI